MAVLPIYTFPDEADVSLNREVLLATVILAFVTAILFGVAPAIAASRRLLQESANSVGRGNTGFRQGHLRNGFIVSQVALSLMLLSAAGLLMRTFFLQRGVDLGIRTDHLLTSALNLPATSYGDESAQSRFVRGLLSRLERVPGVLSVAAAVETPPHGGIPTDFDIGGISHTSTWKGIASPCTSRYFDTIGLRLLAGRVPTVADENNRRRVAVINQTMALHYFGRANPIGRSLQLAAFQATTSRNANPSFEVIGVISDLKNNGAREAVLPEIYIPYTFGDFSGFRLYMYTRLGVLLRLRARLQKKCSSRIATSFHKKPWPWTTFSKSWNTRGHASAWFSTFASIGLILVIVGVYSVASYSVAQRQREIGIRMALGARPLEIRKLVLRNKSSVLLLGVGIGVLLCSLLTGLLANQIWGV